VLNIVDTAIVKFFLLVTSSIRYAVADELLCPFESTKATILVAPRVPRGVLMSLPTVPFH
jgi:hypothetical protein